MRSATSFRSILALRGRIVLFTATAPVGLIFEQVAERDHAKVIHSRGWADSYGPVGEWHKLHHSREYGVFSADQQRYVGDIPLPATDLVWVGETGNPHTEPHLWQRFSQAMSKDISALEPPRLWLISEDAL